MIYAREIAVRSFSNAADTFSTMRSLGIDLTSLAEEEVQSGFPFVTMPNWEERTFESRRVSFDEMMAFAPLVPSYNRSLWETYSEEHQGWIEEGLNANGYESIPIGSLNPSIHDFPSHVTPDDFVSFVSIMEELSSPEQREWVLDAYRDGPTLDDVFVPLWQMGPAPLDASIINSDLMSVEGIAQLLLEVVVNRHGVLCPFSIVGPKLVGSTWQGMNTETTDRVPHSALIEPVMSGFDDDSPVGGFIIADVPWSSFFIGVLPEGVGKVLVVIADTCGNMELTLSLDGPDVTLLGFGDRHDRSYDHLVFERPWKSGPGSVVVNARNQAKLVNSFNTPSYPHHCEFNIKVRAECGPDLIKLISFSDIS